MSFGIGDGVGTGFGSGGSVVCAKAAVEKASSAVMTAKKFVRGGGLFMF
jgi:hypothetical protein